MDFLKITTPYSHEIGDGDSDIYLLALKKTLKKVLPAGFFQEELLINSHCKEKTLEKWNALLPLVEWTSLKTPPFHLSFFLFCPFLPNAFRFFQEMISRWLIPGNHLNPISQFAMAFYLPELCNTLYIGGEIVLHIETIKQLHILEKNLPIIETEVRLGVQSSYQANRILEIKGLSTDEKTAMIQENIARIAKHRPQDFDLDVFSEMQHFLVLCKDEFKAEREYKHMSRIICFHYLFRKGLKHSLEAFPERRFVSIKLLRVTLTAHSGKKKRVLGIVIGLSFLRENEVFSQRHILRAIKNYIPYAKAVKGSFFKNAFRADPTCMVYQEIEKEDETPFTLEETSLLKQELPDAIDDSIEERYNPVFMPQNEEEILRNILTLSSQLKYVKDLPQAILSFERQTENTLEFLIIAVRIIDFNTDSFQNCFVSKPTFLQFIPDRIKIVGFLRKKYRKEANVFRVQVKKEHYLRHDHSVDLYKARIEVAHELARIIGEFRDFNGGTISKETELFTALRKLAGKKGKEHAFLLENFFYSILPAVMRSILKPSALKKLFHLLVESSHKGIKEIQTIECYSQEDLDFIYLVLVADEPYFRKDVQEAIERLHGDNEQVASCFVSHNGLFCMGILARRTLDLSPLKLRLVIEEVVSINIGQSKNDIPSRS